MVSTALQSKQIKFWIPGRVVPKARPRFSGGRTLLPANYRHWRWTAELELIHQTTEKAWLPITLPFQQALIEVNLSGKHRGDLDNLAGSCLDALVSAGVLSDDNVNCVPSLTVTYQPAGELGVSIVVKPQSSAIAPKRQARKKSLAKSN